MLDINVLKGVVRETVGRLNTLHVLSANVLVAEGGVTKIGYIPWKRWKVVGAGLIIPSGGVWSDHALVAEWGNLEGDLSAAADPDDFLKYTQITAGNHHLDVGDIIYHGDLRAVAEPEATTDADVSGTTVEGAMYNLWQTKATYVAIKLTAAGGTGDAIGFIVVEVDNAVQLEG